MLKDVVYLGSSIILLGGKFGVKVGNIGKEEIVWGNIAWLDIETRVHIPYRTCESSK